MRKFIVVFSIVCLLVGALSILKPYQAGTCDPQINAMTRECNQWCLENCVAAENAYDQLVRISESGVWCEIAILCLCENPCDYPRDLFE